MRLILEEHARPLLDIYCASTVTAATLAIVAATTPNASAARAAFAKLCGACPIPASSGKTNRHRLNKGGNRQGNSALHHIAIVRMRYHQPTRDYVDRKTGEGKGKMEIIRCLKRFIAARPTGPSSPSAGRTPLNKPPANADDGFASYASRTASPATDRRRPRVHSSRISEIERGTRNLPELERRAALWIQTITTPNQPTNTPKPLTMYRSIKIQWRRARRTGRRPRAARP